jgi:hypothetical protein
VIEEGHPCSGAAGWARAAQRVDDRGLTLVATPIRLVGGRDDVLLDTPSRLHCEVGTLSEHHFESSSSAAAEQREMAAPTGRGALLLNTARAHSGVVQVPGSATPKPQRPVHGVAVVALLALSGHRRSRTTGYAEDRRCLLV